MDLHASICPGCGSRKLVEAKLCLACEKLYGPLPSKWRAWLRFSRNDYRRQIVQAQRIAEHEVPLNEFECYGEDSGSPVEDTDLRTRGGEQMGWSRRPADVPWFMDDYGLLILPWAPYSDHKTNIAYRKANGVYRRL